MPEFILNDESSGRPGNPDRFDSLNEFARGYVEAMFFTNADCGECSSEGGREDHANELGVDRLTRSAVRSIREDCAAFEREAEPYLTQAYERPDYSPEQAGRDFWFTRQGHGVGFWDRSQLDAPPSWKGRPAGESAESLGAMLTGVAKRFGETYPQIWNGWIYH